MEFLTLSRHTVISKGVYLPRVKGAESYLQEPSPSLPSRHSTAAYDPRQEMLATPPCQVLGHINTPLLPREPALDHLVSYDISYGDTRSVCVSGCRRLSLINWL